jgi:hypothetical protein
VVEIVGGWEERGDASKWSFREEDVTGVLVFDGAMPAVGVDAEVGVETFRLGMALALALAVADRGLDCTGEEET